MRRSTEASFVTTAQKRIRTLWIGGCGGPSAIGDYREFRLSLNGNALDGMPKAFVPHHYRVVNPTTIQISPNDRAHTVSCTIRVA